MNRAFLILFCALCALCGWFACAQPALPPVAGALQLEPDHSVVPSLFPEDETTDTNSFPPGGWAAWSVLHPAPTNQNNFFTLAWNGETLLPSLAQWFDTLQESQDLITWSNVGPWYLVETNDIAEILTNDFAPLNVFRVARSTVQPATWVTQ
jgi:hypothetical protein